MRSKEPKPLSLNLCDSNEEDGPKPLSLSMHLNLSLIEDSKGYQPATHKAIEKILMLQKRQEELGTYFLTKQLVYDFFYYVEKEKNKNKGFGSNKDAVNEYLNTLCHTILGYSSLLHIYYLTISRTIDTYIEDFLFNINTPLNEDSERKLAKLHVYEPPEENQSQNQQPLILSVDLYLAVEERIKVHATYLFDYAYKFQ